MGLSPQRILAGMAVLSLAVFSAPTSGGAASITTLFASNNGGNPGGAVYFDIEIAANPITITGFETNTHDDNLGDSFSFEVFTVVGTRVGNELNAGVWTSMATGTGIGAGMDNLSLITLDNSFTLNASTGYGMAIVLDGPAGAARNKYTNGTGANQLFSNADLSLELGSASNEPFSVDPLRHYAPRVWNGTIIYTASSSPMPEPSAWLLFGVGSLIVGAALRKESSRAA